VVSITLTGNPSAMPHEMAIAGVMGDVEGRAVGDHLEQASDWRKM